MESLCLRVIDLLLFSFLDGEALEEEEAAVGLDVVEVELEDDLEEEEVMEDVEFWRVRERLLLLLLLLLLSLLLVFSSRMLASFGWLRSLNQDLEFSRADLGETSG